MPTVASDDSEHRGVRRRRLNGGAAADDDGRGSDTFDEDLDRAKPLFVGFLLAVSWIASGDTVFEVLGVGMLLMLPALWYRQVVEGREFVRSIREFDEDYDSEGGDTCA